MGLSHKDQSGGRRKCKSLKPKTYVTTCHQEQSSLKQKPCQEISIAVLLALRCGKFYSCKDWRGNLEVFKEWGKLATGRSSCCFLSPQTEPRIVMGTCWLGGSYYILNLRLSCRFTVRDGRRERGKKQEKKEERQDYYCCCSDQNEYSGDLPVLHLDNLTWVCCIHSCLATCLHVWAI